MDHNRRLTDKMSDKGDPWHKILEHEFRLEAFERLFANQEKVVADLAKSVADLQKQFTTSINRLIIAIIVVTLLGEEAIPTLIKMATGL